MREHPVGVIGHVGAALATLLPARPEHEVLDDQLAAPAEKVRERNASAPALEAVVLFDLHPRKRPAFRRERVHLAGELFFFREEFRPGGEPFGARGNRVIRISCSLMVFCLLLFEFHFPGLPKHPVQ